MSTAPPTGPMVGEPRSPRVGFVMPSPNLYGLAPMLNALLARYGQAMDIGMQELARQPARNEMAFNEWLAKRAEDRKMQSWAARNAFEEQMFRRGQEQDALRQAQGAALGEQMNERAARQASVDRNVALHTTYGGPTPFNPAGSLADYYEYGAGNPQGRGGGGSTGTPSDPNAIMRCLASPTSPGCPQDPLGPGGQGT